jgi:hypothetical protein
MPPLEVLYKLRKQRPDVFDKLEGVYPTTLKNARQLSELS